MRVLLLGAGGQLAREFEACLANQEVRALTHDQLDIYDAVGVRAEVMSFRPECVINAAAFNRVDECEEQPGESFAVNAIGPYNLARAAAEASAVLVHFSTDYVFDGSKRSPYLETDRPNPQSVYAFSKYAGESLVERYCEKFFLIRTCGLYGSAGRARRAGKSGNFVETMLRFAREGKPIRVVNDQVLTPTSAQELAQRVLPLLGTDRYGLYHMTNTGECSWYDFAREIFRLAGLSPDLQPVSTAEYGARARRPAYSILDNAAYRAAGFSDFRPWQEALADYLRTRQG